MTRATWPAVRSAPPSPRPVAADLILLTEPDQSFAVHVENGRVACPRLPLDQVNGYDLRGLVKETAKRSLDLDLSDLGVLAFEPTDESHSLVVAAATRELPGGSRLQRLALSEIKARGRDVQHREYFEPARQWHEATMSADTLSRDIEQAMSAAVRLLAARRAQEGGRCGWDQYLRSDSVGILSTGNGILTCVHAGAGHDLIEEPVATLRAFQDPEGGWSIRRSLMGADSDAPITESTCVCLWALHEMGVRSLSDPTVAAGIAWLERTRRPDGGWPSSAADNRSLVFPTASAVRVLALYNRSEAVAGGVAWLRGAQCADGGWGATASTRDDAASSSAMYTAAALLALSSGGMARADRAVRTGCDHLIKTFSPERPEPWTSTSFTLEVDPVKHARMDFRHFATPWALAALCEVGYDLSDPIVLTATRHLLRLQQPSGAWRCDQTAPDDTAIWAVHGAVYALRTVIDSSGRALAPLIRDRGSAAEQQALASLAGSMLVRHEAEGAVAGRGRGRLVTAWMSILTVAVAMLVLGQLGVLAKLESSSGLNRAGAVLATFFVTIISGAVPSAIAEVIRVRRGRDHGL